ncbi:MAG: hypothetical protein ABIH66_01080 [bacterium]
MKNPLTLATLNLHAILPLLEEIVGFDEEAAKIIKGWNASLRFSVSGGPAATLKFRNGKLKTTPDKNGIPSVGFWFSSPEKLNNMFEGKGIPVLWTGFWHIGILKGFMALTKRLEYYMKNENPDQLLSDRKIFDFYIKLSLYTIVRGVKAVAENDPEVRPLFEKARDGTVQIEVLPDGPTVHATLRGGKVEAGIGPAEKANCYMRFRNSDVAYRLIKGELDSFAALGSCDLIVDGFVPLVDTLDIALEHLGRYLQ